MPHSIDWSGCPIIERDPKKLQGVPTIRSRVRPETQPPSSFFLLTVFPYRCAVS